VGSGRGLGGALVGGAYCCVGGWLPVGLGETAGVRNGLCDTEAMMKGRLSN
jgi:hypothetical protein